jgi:O-succinylbenzoate synthase
VRQAAAVDLAGCATVGELAALAAGTLDRPYDRAALEASAIDLALRQAATAPAALLHVEPRALRYVVSFARCDDPVSRARDEIARGAGFGLKIDADPDWSDRILAGLAALERVDVLDFKLTGRVADHERAHRLVPRALLEDPLPGERRWSPGVRGRLTADAAVTSASALEDLREEPVAVNVKPARMGGVLEALDAVARCARRGVAVYLGGMFEVGPGRAQLHALAALLCPDAPNDVAPIALGDAEPPRPPRLEPPSGAGFAGAG